jgi:hypothetical protein
MTGPCPVFSWFRAEPQPVHLLPTCRAPQETSTSSTARIDEERVIWLVERGYDVIVDAIDAIPANISDKNRSLLGRRR